jgi:D-xylose transport system substrate-binding protein
MSTKHVLAAAATALALAAAGCGGDDEESAGGGGGGGGGGEPQRVAVLLPDADSSPRWESLDRPGLQRAFDAAGVPVEIQNAGGDPATQRQQAEQALTNGAKVLLLTNLDSGSGAAIVANAKSQGARVIDYDRLTLNGDSDYYVSFDNRRVGQLQGEGLVSCLEEAGVSNPRIAVLNGSPTDNNATLFKQGYDSVLNPLFDGGQATEVADQSVPEWDPQRALTIFEQMLQRANNRIDGVLAANDNLGNSAISALRARNLDQIPVTGQDASLQGVQNIVTGDQCMTVYKAVEEEAQAAARLAIALARGEQPQGVQDRINNGQKDVPSVFLEPVAVTRENIGEYVDAPDFPDRDEICVGRVRQACQEAGL